MDIQSVAQLIPLLQTAIGPVIMISGIGLLLLTMTNRYGRVIDRSRMLVDDLPNAAGENRAKIVAQLQIFWKRARLIRLVIALSSVSALCAAILIIVIFITALWQIETAWIIMSLFILCMMSLIASLTLFIYDINQSLGALKLKLETEGIDKG
ncbi:MAG: DUF2721 domain-containing protein [Anaerolineales bacterium]|nr:DUF2721 domain-containing protein [Chloroflexota bacterium]MBL7162945.1 DUF2721 domain-containing protein [Anaerolineales bacterium]